MALKKKMIFLTYRKRKNKKYKNMRNQTQKIVKDKNRRVKAINRKKMISKMIKYDIFPSVEEILSF